jgi:hypothetical protein
MAGSTLSPPAFHSTSEKAKAVGEYTRHHPVPPPLIGPKDYPIDILGSFRFPQAPKVDLSPPASPAPIRPTGTDLEIPEDLSIPVYLRRHFKDGDTP